MTCPASGDARNATERQGLVRRERSSADGRLAYVTLTVEGHALVERSMDELLRHEESLLAPLSEDQRSDLSDLLRILLNGLPRDNVTISIPSGTGNPAEMS